MMQDGENVITPWREKPVIDFIQQTDGTLTAVEEDNPDGYVTTDTVIEVEQ